MAQTGCTSTQYTIPDLSGGTITPMHATYVNENKEQYQYSDSDRMEIRELFVFTCSGFRIN